MKTLSTKKTKDYNEAVVVKWFGKTVTYREINGNIFRYKENSYKEVGFWEYLTMWPLFIDLLQD